MFYFVYICVAKCRFTQHLRLFFEFSHIVLFRSFFCISNCDVQKMYKTHFPQYENSYNCQPT
jgi:hypothetical protein